MRSSPTEDYLMRTNIFKYFIWLALFLTSATAMAATESTQIDTSETEILDTDEDINSESLKSVTSINQAVLTSNQVDTDSRILNKKIKFSNRFQLALDSGQFQDELIANARYSQLRLSYFINEDYSVGIGYRDRFGGKTSAANQFEQSAGSLDFDKAPQAKKSGFVTFGYNLFYGKMSFTDTIATPAVTQLVTDFGFQSFGSTSRPYLQTGLHQLFYLGSHVSLGLNLGFSLAEISDATSLNINNAQPAPNEANFTSKIQFNKFIGMNLNFIL